MKVKAGDYIMIGDHTLYCRVKSYDNGWINFDVINGAWEGMLSDAGVLKVLGFKDRLILNQRVTHVFLPGENKGDYNQVINALRYKPWHYGVTRYINYYFGRWPKVTIKALRIKLANWIDPRTKWEKQLDSDIPF